MLNIVIKNPDKKEKGIMSLTVNGKVMKANFIPFNELNDSNEVIAVMG
jgi:hypothetical protein